jgi:hypothetical protein
MMNLSVLLLFTLLPAQQNPPTDEMGPYLGVLFSRVPEALLDHLPQMPREGAVLITHVLPDSPAATAGVKKHDILLTYNGEKIRDGNHVVRLIQNGKSGQTVRLGLLRGGRETTVDARLTLGPMLKVAKEEGNKAPGIAKPGAPPAVTVTAVPKDGNRLQITFEYSDLGRIQRVTCSGNAEEIDREIKKLPIKVQSFANAAVRQLRHLKLQ